ncbi:MAG: DNA-3-methyladenine glycosylase I [Pseudomonadota bacterium]|nr:DNA-3-methyladenine glycosylase I [Pseudomonadota bacterium]
MAKLKQEGLYRGNDYKMRCFWPGDDPAYLAYHDKEWGIPVADDHKLYEKICLEGFQSGLSWLTILRKRENFRAAFANFDFEKIAKFSNRDIERLLKDDGIVRHLGKIKSTVNNAKRAIEIVEEFGTLGAFFWHYEPNEKARPRTLDFKTMRALGKTPESEALSKELKRRGWSFIGPTTAYAFMQAMGMVNDHIEGCEFREAVEHARKNFKRPS